MSQRKRALPSKIGSSEEEAGGPVSIDTGSAPRQAARPTASASTKRRVRAAGADEPHSKRDEKPPVRVEIDPKIICHGIKRFALGWFLLFLTLSILTSVALQGGLLLIAFARPAVTFLGILLLAVFWVGGVFVAFRIWWKWD